ncbi:MAG: hypothetical protein ABI597_04225 [Gammaproteobacteria bacterium]
MFSNFLSKFKNNVDFSKPVPHVKELKKQLENIRNTVLTDKNPYALDLDEQNYLNTVLNTLLHLVEHIDDANILYSESVLYLPDPLAPIHLENYLDYSQTDDQGFKQLIGEKRKEYILKNLVNLFILSFNKVHAAEKKQPGVVKLFCSKCNGYCIDARTRDAMSYALTLGRPAFSDLVKTLAEKSGSDKYFTSLAFIFDKCRNELFSADTGTNGYCKKEGNILDNISLVASFLKNILVHDVDKSFLAIAPTISSNSKRLPIFLSFISEEIDFIKTLNLDHHEQKIFDELTVPSDNNRPGLLDIALQKLDELTNQCDPNFTSPLDFAPEKAPAKKEEKSDAKLKKTIDPQRKAERIKNATRQLENQRETIAVLLSKVSPQKQKAFTDPRKILKTTKRTRAQTLVRSITLDLHQSSSMSDTEVKEQNSHIDKRSLTATLSQAVDRHRKNLKAINFIYLETILCGLEPDIMMEVVNQQKQLFVDLAKEHQPGTTGYKSLVELIGKILERLHDNRFKGLLNNSPFIAIILEVIDEKTAVGFLQRIVAGTANNSEVEELFQSNNILAILIRNKQFELFAQVGALLSKLGIFGNLFATEHLLLAVTNCDQIQVSKLLAIVAKRVSPDSLWESIQRTLNQVIDNCSAQSLNNFLAAIKPNLTLDLYILLFSKMIFSKTTPYDNIIAFITFGIKDLKIDAKKMSAFCLAQCDKTSIYLHTISALTGLNMSNDIPSPDQIKIVAGYKHEFIKQSVPTVIEDLSKFIDSTTVALVSGSAFSQLPEIKGDAFEEKEEDSFPIKLLNAISHSQQAIEMIDFVLLSFPTSMAFSLMKVLVELADNKQFVLFKFLNSPLKDIAKGLFIAVFANPELKSILNNAPIQDKNELISSLAQAMPVDDEKKQDRQSSEFQTTLLTFIKESPSIGNMVESIASGLSEENIIRLVKEYKQTEPELFGKTIEALRVSNKAKTISFLNLVLNDSELTELFKKLPIPTQNNFLIRLFARIPSEDKGVESCVAKISTYLVKITNQNRIIAAGKALVILNTKPVNCDALEILRQSVVANHHNLFSQSDLATYIGDYLKTVPVAKAKLVSRSPKIAVA